MVRNTPFHSTGLAAVMFALAVAGCSDAVGPDDGIGTAHPQAPVMDHGVMNFCGYPENQGDWMCVKPDPEAPDSGDDPDDPGGDDCIKATSVRGRPQIGVTGCGGGGGSTEPSDSDTDTPIGVPIADDEQVDCHQNNTGSKCDLKPADAMQKELATKQVDRMRTDGICGHVRTEAYAQVEHLQVWPAADTVWHVEDGVQKILLGDIRIEFVDAAGTEYEERIDIWEHELTNNPWTFAHETLHVMGYHHADEIQGPDGLWRSMDQTAKYCAGLT